MLCGYKINVNDFILELIGINNNVMIFAWYVPFYIFSMLFLPKYIIFIEKNGLLKSAIITIFVCLCLKLYIKYAEINSYLIYNNLMVYFPCIMSGYLCARYKLLDIIFKCICSAKKSIFVIFLLLALYQLRPNMGINMGFIYFPIFLVAISIINIYKIKFLNTVLNFLAKHSMNIWFLHCIFFSNVTNQYFMKFAFITPIVIIDIFWILGICSILSIFITKVQNKIINNIF